MKKKLYLFQLSLGSNIEPRLKFLKQSVELLQKNTGIITNFSAIYETPTWGFVSTPFLNACITLKTKFSTKELLFKIQEIEKEIGRKPKIAKAYEARPIDIDILYSSEGIFNYPNLVVPHPFLQKRKFVLVPLKDTVPDFKHPLLHKTNTELLNDCTDNSEIIVTDLKFQ